MTPLLGGSHSFISNIPIQLPIQARRRGQTSGTNPWLPLTWLGCFHHITHDGNALNNALALKVIEHKMLSACLLYTSDAADEP